MRELRCCFILGSLLLLSGCEAYPRVEADLLLPEGMSGPAERLKLEFAVTKDKHAKPLFDRQVADEVQPIPGGFRVRFGTAVGNRTYAYLRAWYDADGDGTKSPGDAVGSLKPEPFEAHDPGMFSCGSNLNRAPTIQLQPVARLTMP